NDHLHIGQASNSALRLITGWVRMMGCTPKVAGRIASTGAVVRPKGLEPPRVSPPAPKAGASTSSATAASQRHYRVTAGVTRSTKSWVLLKAGGTPDPAGSLPRWLLCSPFRTKGPEPRRLGACGGVFLWVQRIRPHWQGSFVSGREIFLNRHFVPAARAI